MEALLGWQSLVFYVPVAFGALLAVGAAFGFAGADVHGPDVDAHGDGGGHGDGALDVLSAGRLPLTLRLMLLAFAFGGVGLVLGPLVRGALGAALGGGLSVAVSVAGAAVIDRAVGRFVARRVPLFQTETVRRAELVGAVGRVVLAVSARGGVAHVRDRRGNLHQVSCRLLPGEAGASLPAGAEVLLVEHDEAQNVFFVGRAS